MKYCTNCGAELGNSTASFCSECGQPLQTLEAAHEAPVEKEENVPTKQKKKKKSKKEKPVKQRKKKEKKAQKEMIDEPVDDGYDGYYNDVLPPDLDRVKEGLDKELIKKIVAVAVGVVFIISMCVVMLYVL